MYPEEAKQGDIFVASSFRGFGKQGDLLFKTATRSVFEEYMRGSRATVFVRCPNEIKKRIAEKPHYLQNIIAVAKVVKVPRPRLIIANPLWIGDVRIESGWGFYDATGLWRVYSSEPVRIINWEWGNRDSWQHAGTWDTLPGVTDDHVRAIPITEKELRARGYYKYSEVSERVRNKIHLSRSPL